VDGGFNVLHSSTIAVDLANVTLVDVAKIKDTYHRHGG
jgi:hypothetical protein